MRPPSRRRFIFAATGAMLVARGLLRSPALAAPSVATAPERLDQDGFVPLFNGRDLAGWAPVNVAPHTFSVQKGLIVSTGVPTGVMRTTRHYENFILELEWKHLRQGGNAGLFIHAEPLTAVGVPFAKAIEVQILDGDSPEGIWTGHGDVFSIHGAKMVPDRPHPRGWERCLPLERRAKPAGEWNHYRVENRDGRLTLAVNGKVVSGASQCRPRKGYLCLESEGSECHFRHLRIKELPSSNPPPAEVAGLDEGFRSLYTGVDLRGWKAGTETAVHWRAKDWMLDCDGQGPAELWNEKTWSDFTLICDWRVPDPKGTAGLLLRGSPKCEVSLPAGAGQWNRAVVTWHGARLSVSLNGQKPLASVAQSDLPPRGPFALRHHGYPVQFANLYVKLLD